MRVKIGAYSGTHFLIPIAGIPSGGHRYFLNVLQKSGLTVTKSHAHFYNGNTIQYTIVKLLTKK